MVRRKAASRPMSSGRRIKPFRPSLEDEELAARIARLCAQTRRRVAETQRIVAAARALRRGVA
jgi:hypothetical protein